MKNFKTTLTLMFLCTIVLMTNAQDLIKDARNGIQHAAAKKAVEPNNISKKVKETFENNGYLTSKAFTLEKNQKQLVAKRENQVKDAVYLTLNESEVAKILQTSPEALKLQIPVTETNNIELELIKNDFTATGFKITTSGGEEFGMPEGAIFYKGYVKGDPNSIAGISVFNGKIIGVLSDQNGDYNLGRLKNDHKKIALYNSKDLNSEYSLNCGANDLDQQSTENLVQDKIKSLGNGVEKKIKRDSNDCVGVYFEVSYELYQAFNSSESEITEYITLLFNLTSTVFEDLDSPYPIKICISQIYIWTTNDNYDETVNQFEVFAQFSNKLRNSDIPGNIGILAYSGNGGAANSSYSLCHDHTTTSGNGSNGAIGLQKDITNFDISVWSRDAFLLTHELGHTFGSPHTNQCSWTIEGVANQAVYDCEALNPVFIWDPATATNVSNCGTQANFWDDQIRIMHNCSFSPTLSLGFGPVPKQLMYNSYQAAITEGCLTSNGNGNPSSSSCNDAFAAYSWLSSKIPANTCAQVTEYYYSSHWSFLYVVYGNAGTLYLSNGDVYGTDSGDGSRVTIQGLNTITNQWSCECGGQTQVSGCTDAGACNYNPQATVDNGSCEYTSCNPTQSTCNDALAAYPWLSSKFPANTCVEIYDYLANDNYWHYIYVKYNGQGALYLNHNQGSPYGNDNGDRSILNTYSLTNLVNQWSCGCGGQTQVSGCTDAGACNYNPQATVENGSCEYTSCNPTSTCDAAFGAYNWLMGVVPANVCTQITEYYFDPSWNFIYMVSGNVATLYLSNGANYGMDSGDGRLVADWGLNTITNQWSCGCGGFRVGDQLNENEFLVMPNPNNGQFNLVLSKTITEEATAEIYSIEGKKMKTIELNNAAQQQIDVSDFNSGLYLLKLTSDSYSSTQRFTIR